MCAGALEYEPQHDRQLPEQGGLRIGKYLVLIVRKEEPREAQDDVGDAVDDQPHANEPRQETRLIRQGSHGEEPEPPQDLGGNDLSVMQPEEQQDQDRKSTRLNSSHGYISYAVFCLKKKKKQTKRRHD